MIERFKYTDIKCTECNGTVVLGSRGDLYCLDCGLLHNHIEYGYGFLSHKWHTREEVQE
jgi:hypothetical protein